MAPLHSPQHFPPRRRPCLPPATAPLSSHPSSPARPASFTHAPLPPLCSAPSACLRPFSVALRRVLPLLLLLLLCSRAAGKSAGPSAAVAQKACQESAKNMLLMLYKLQPVTAGVYMSTNAYLNVMAWCSSTKGNVTVFCPTDDSFSGKFAPSTDQTRLRAILSTMTIPAGYRSIMMLRRIKPGTQIMTTSGRPIVAQGGLAFRGVKPSQFNYGIVLRLGYQDSWMTVYLVKGLMLPDFL